MTGLTIALAQINTYVGDVGYNAQKIIRYAKQARDEVGADLIVFPELTLSGYPPEDLVMRRSLLQWCESELYALLQEVMGIDVILGTPWQDGKGLRNSALVLRDGDIIARYDKQVLPNYSVFDEKRYFVRGHDACVFDCKGVSVGVTICEDIWQPEPAAVAAEAGAELLVNINASPFHNGKQGERIRTLEDRVTETQLPIIYVNAVGGQDELVFDGQSTVINADGQIHIQAEAFEEGLYVGRAPFVRTVDKPDNFEHIGLIYEALVCGVRDYLDKNGFNGALLGLSGGIDSALTLAIAHDAVGNDRVTAVMMPSQFTSQMSLDDAQKEADILDIDYRVIPIETVFESFLDLLNPVFHGLPVDATEENIQARCRGIILMAISNKTGRLLLTTGNKSEMAVGYATLYGDMAGGFAPLKDASKLLVYELARYRNSIYPVIPERVLTRPPSAELAEDQLDSDSLPPYEILDPILEMYIEQDRTVEEIAAAGYNIDTVVRIANMVLRNEYKRRQAPPGVRITQRGFGKDRRYPITSGYFRRYHRQPVS